MLSENLKFELIVHMNGSMLSQMKCFEAFDVLFLAQVSQKLQRIYYHNNEVIFEEL